MEQTRRFPVPFDRRRRKAGRGHLAPKLGVESGRGFLCLPGFRPVEFGMIGFLGVPITTIDVLERWVESGTLPISEADAVLAVDGYLRQIQAFRVGAIVEITY